MGLIGLFETSCKQLGIPVLKSIAFLNTGVYLVSLHSLKPKTIAMNTQKFLVSGIVGGIVSFFAGYLIYGLCLTDFFAKNAGTATGVMRPMTDMIWWSVILGSIFMGLTFSYIFNRWANINSLSAGASAGAVIGLLMTAGTDFLMYGTANLNNLTGTVVDVIAGAVMGAITGAVVGLANGMGAKKAV